MTYPKALPLALPKVHMFDADVFAETAEELRRTEKERERKVGDFPSKWQRQGQNRLPSKMARGEDVATEWEAAGNGKPLEWQGAGNRGSDGLAAAD